MKIFNTSFLAINKTEFDFLEQRHAIDRQLFQEFPQRMEITHLKMHEPDYMPEAHFPDEIFFPGRNGFFHIPWSMCRYVRQQQPDIVIIHSFKFPWQLLALKWFLPAKTKIIVQHHAEAPFKNIIKAWLQRRAYGKASAYLFSSQSLAADFIAAMVIPSSARVIELPESTTFFHARDKHSARERLALDANKLRFLWVGRLNANKDPFTALTAFNSFVKIRPDAALYMFYHQESMQQQVMDFIRQHSLQQQVHLMGNHPQRALEDWYNACDFFISASHYESTGYALCEALACGCVPVVTDIPAYTALTGNGEFGILFKPGNTADLYEKLCTLPQGGDYAALQQKIVQHFNEKLSFTAISRKMMSIVQGLTNEPVDRTR